MKPNNPIEWLGRTRPAALVIDAAKPVRPEPVEGDKPVRPELVEGAFDGLKLLPGSNAAICSLAQAREWLGEPASIDSIDMPAFAQRLREAGTKAVCITGVDHADGRFLDWLDSEHARGWLAPTGAAIGSLAHGELFATEMAAALGRGFVAADAAVIARMACTGAAAGAADFINDPVSLPLLSWGEQPQFVDRLSADARTIGLYAIVDSAQRLEQVLLTDVRTVQLRIKAPPVPDSAWRAMLRREVEQSIRACRAADAELFVNDHWELAGELGASGVHLGQEDLVALGDAGRAALLATGVALGISSHSLWELCRARSLAPRYIACGPVWPTLTKAMPWIAQGLGNLAWWCRMAGAPVVAIGGILGPGQVYDAARSGADGVCVVRGLGDDPREVVPQFQAALAGGRREFTLRGTHPAWPHPSLPILE